MTEETKKPQSTEEKPKDEYVKLKKSDIDTLMGEIKAMRDSQSMLLQMADKQKLQRFKEANQGEREAEARLTTINGKVVVKWSDLTENEAGKNQNGTWAERHEFDAQYEDGETQHFTLREFNQHQQQITGVIKKQYQNEDLDTMLDIDVNGKIYKVNILFINR